MSDAASLLIKVKSSGIDKTTKDLKKLETQGKETEGMTKSLGASFVKMGAVAGIAVAAIGVGLFVKSIKNTIEQERVVAQLNQTLKSTGRFSKEASGGLQDYAAQLQTVSTFGDEAIIASQALMFTFTQISGSIMPRAQQAVLDVATAMGTGLKSASIQVGKALNDPVEGMSALSRSGITFSKDQKELVKSMVAVGDTAGAQKLILKELEVQFGGSAKAAKDTLGGSLKSLSNAFGDLLEAKKGGPNELTASVNSLTDTLNSPEVKEGMQTLTSGFLSIASAALEATASIVNFFTGGDNKTLKQEIFLLQNLINNNMDFGSPEQNKAKNQELLFLKNKLNLLTGITKTTLRDHHSKGGSGAIIAPVKEPVLIDNKVNTNFQGDNRLDEFNKLTAAANELNKSLRTPKEIYDDEIKSLNILRSTQNERTTEALISNDTYNRARIKAEETYADSLEKTSLISASAHGKLDESLLKTTDNFEVFKNNIDSWGQTFAQTMANGSGSFTDFAQTVVKQMQIIAIQQATQPLFDGFSTMLGDFFKPTISGSTSAMFTGAPSMDGGGFTGNGSRSGGVDGIGGFPAILHPNETVIDHTKGQKSGSSMNIVVNVDASSSSSTGDADGQSIGNLIGIAVRSVLIEESRPGGLLA